ncbi:MAG TPA: polymer-forming cytoskeletal protein [Casimicrobiaceae bacterium]|nr:polymer-forming cytoskeletal protein [Casimicrobiaceae bacterium]
MLGFNRTADAKEGVKPGLKPALYEPPVSSTRLSGIRAPSPAPITPPREATSAGAPTVHAQPAPEPAPAAPVLNDAPGSKLFVGINIKLKGVEISDCDALVIEGQVEATVHSKLMQVAQPGTLHGTALIDVAEIHGEFSGELTARTRLVVHGTGRVSGTIRYGKLIVEEGGELSGDVKRLDAGNEQAQQSLLAGSSPRY